MNSFNLELAGNEVELVMNALNEMPAKVSRNLMNKIEQQAIFQIRQFEANQAKQPESNERAEPDIPQAEAK